MTCPACGFANEPGRKFCGECGVPIATVCSACATPNAPGMRYCGECGEPLPGSPPVRARAPESSTGAERRLVTVLFADLVGFTTLAEARDSESVRELLTEYFETVRPIIETYGGAVEKFIGDAVMAVWGTPTAHEDDAERAVRAALDLVAAVGALEGGIQARASVLTGEAAVTLGATDDRMVAGDLVNTASRLQGIAEAGTVVVGEATRRAAEAAILFEKIGDEALKGKSSPVPAWRAVRVVASIGGEDRPDTLEAPFVGRDEELRQLKDVLHAVGRDRRPRLVSITGAAGIGKSRLAWELEKYVAGVTEPIFWHRGRSPSYGEGITFFALGQMVRRRAQLNEEADEATTRERITATLEEYIEDPEERARIGAALLALLGVVPAPAGGRDVLFPAWRAFFESIAERGTTVLVFEDLQWADVGMLDFIEHLLEWSRPLPIMVVSLARPELFDRRPDWGAGRRQLTALALAPLSDAEIRGLLDGLVPGLPEDVVAAIVRRAEGVPLYAVETVRGLLGDGRIARRGNVYEAVGDVSDVRLPDSLHALVASRLDALDDPERSLLLDASVLGQVFTAEALGAIAQVSPDDLETLLHGLVRRELIDVERDPRSPEHGQYKFVQALIREVAYARLARRDRRSRHLAVARYWEAVGDEELAGALANHYLAAYEASEPGKEADALAAQTRLALSAAAKRATSLGAHRQAVAYLAQALGITPEAGLRAQLLDRAAASAAVAASSDAERYAEEAVGVYRAGGDDRAAVEATARLGRIVMDGTGDAARARQLLEAAMPAAEELGDPTALAALRAHLARAYWRTGDAERALAVADQSLSIAERHNVESLVAEGFVNKAAALGMLGRRRESLAIVVAAAELAARIGDRDLELRARNNIAATLVEDDPLGAMEVWRDLLAVAQDMGDIGSYVWVAGTLGYGYIAEGRFEDALAVVSDALDALSKPADRARLRLIILTIAIARGERLAEIAVELEQLAEQVGATADGEAMVDTVRSERALASGDARAAFRHAMHAAGLPVAEPAGALLAALRAATAAKDAAAVRAAQERISQLASSGALTVALRQQADAARAAMDGRNTDAVRLFRAVHDRLYDLGLAFDAARVAVDAAILLPDEPDIRSLAERSRPLLVEIGASPYVERLDRALGGASVGVPPPAGSGVGAGQPREVPRPAGSNDTE